MALNKVLEGMLNDFKKDFLLKSIYIIPRFMLICNFFQNRVDNIY